MIQGHIAFGVLLVAVLAARPVPAEDGAPVRVPGSGPDAWMVVLDEPGSVAGRAVLLREGVTLLRDIPALGVLAVSCPPALAEKLAKAPGSRWVSLRRFAARTAGISAGPASLNARYSEKASHSTDRPVAAHPADATGTAADALPLDDDLYFAAQWSLQAIGAPTAWASGHRGKGVRVAVLDTGLDPTHPDLAANVNVSLAASFVPGQTWDVSQDPAPEFDHGTHVAGIIAAADNGFGILGVAPEAELVPIQVLPRPGGHGPPDAVLEGIVYAANIGADIVNMSLHYYYLRRGGINDKGTADPADDEPYSAEEAATLRKAFFRAAAYAHSRGCTLVASAGNESRDADGDRDGFLLPRDAPHVIGVSATGPTGWALDFRADPTRPASYSNYGKSAVDFSAPGGAVDFDLLAAGTLCTVGSGPVSVTLPCWFFDGVLGPAPVKGGHLFEFRRGTSMAAAHVSGVAALIVGRNGGPMRPERVMAKLRESAVDLGECGRDGFYGSGFLNAAPAARKVMKDLGPR